MTTHNNTFTIIRKTVIFILAVLGAMLFVSEPFETSKTWYTDFLVSKALGILVIYIAWLLHDKWDEISEYWQILTDSTEEDKR